MIEPMETSGQRRARAQALAENRRRSAIMAGMLAEPGLVETVRVNVERLNREQGQAVALPAEPTLVDVERAAEALGVPVLALLVAGA